MNLRVCTGLAVVAAGFDAFSSVAYAMMGLLGFDRFVFALPLFNLLRVAASIFMLVFFIALYRAQKPAEPPQP